MPSGGRAGLGEPGELGGAALGGALGGCCVHAGWVAEIYQWLDTQHKRNTQRKAGGAPASGMAASPSASAATTEAAGATA